MILKIKLFFCYLLNVKLYLKLLEYSHKYAIFDRCKVNSLLQKLMEENQQLKDRICILFGPY